MIDGGQSWVSARGCPLPSLLAQRQSARLLSGMLQVRILREEHRTFGGIVAYLFSPPGRLERRGGHPLFGRLSYPVGVSLLKEDGLFRQVEIPSPEEIEAADAAYIGGHDYIITDADEAQDLIDAGYGEWIRDYGYGSGLYGEGVYGAGFYGGEV